MKKRLFKILCCIIVIFFAIPTVSCGSNKSDKIIKDGKTINIKVYRAGYGADYIYDLKNAFEKIYKEEGYSVNILTPARDIQGDVVLQEIYIDSGVDIYFTAGISIEDGLYGTYGKSFTDLTELVFDKSAISFDGQEESKKINLKLGEGLIQDIYDTDGRIYGFPYVEGFGGLVVNKAVLASYGLSLPRTTDELFECYSKIMETSYMTGVYPYTFYNSSNQSSAHLYNMWLAQYSGSDYLDSLWSYENQEGEMRDNGYELFSDDAVYESLKCLYESFDYLAAALGTANQDLATAQGQIMRGSAVFMSAGDYFFKEESLSFSDRLKDITIVNIPVISSLGNKVFGAGTTYGFTKDKSEQILRAAISLIDQNKSIEEIITALKEQFNFTAAVSDVQRICEARGAVYSRTNQINAYISEKSQMKDIAALFLRMCASNDGAKVIAENTYSSNPFSENLVHTESKYEFLSSAESIINNRYLRYHRAEFFGFKKEMGLAPLFPFTGHYLHQHVYREQKTIYNYNGKVVNSKDIYALASRTLADKIAQHAQENWADWVKAAV